MTAISPAPEARMKRLSFLVLAAGILGLAATALSAAESRRVGFLFNLGLMTKEGGSPNWLTIGAELDIPLGTMFSVNPEVTGWGSNFSFHNYYIVPGAMINFRAGRFSFGVGAVRRFWFSSYAEGDSAEKISPKFQVGLRSRNSRIALIIIPFPAQDYVSFGLAFGFGF
jgi:hypothetical protein